MIRTEYKITGGENAKLIQLIPDFKVTSISITRKVDSKLIKEVSKSFEKIDDALDNFITTIVKEYLECIVEYFNEALQYIDDKETHYHLFMYTKKIERNEISIMAPSTYESFREELYSFFEKHWEYPAYQFNDKEFMKEQNNK